MRTRHLTTLMTVVSLLALGQALAQPPTIPNFQRGQVLTADELNRMVGQINKNTNALSEGDGETYTVDCGSGDTIKAAMDQAQPGDTIMISGTCNENVVVNKDGITLDGDDSAVIDGSGVDRAVIFIRGRQDVTIKGLTVQNGIYGIEITQSAAARLEDITARGSRRQSRYEGGSGIAVFNSSSLVLTGTIVANDNARSAITVASSSTAVVLGNGVFDGERFGGASLQASGNGEEGIGVYSGSNFVAAGEQMDIAVTNNGYSGLWIANTGTAFFVGDSSATFNDNGGSGVHVNGGSSATFAFQSAEFNNNAGSGVSVFEGSTATLSGAAINGNQGYAGLWVTRGSTVVAYNLTVENNALRGIGVFRHSFLDLYDSVLSGHSYYGVGVATAGATAVLEGVTSTGNTGQGVSAHSNTSVHIRRSSITDNGHRGIWARQDVHVDIEDSTITGNATDIEVSALARIGWEDSTVGSIVCDDTVLTFNDAMCPE